MKPTRIFNVLAVSGLLASLISCATPARDAVPSKSDRRVRALESELRKRQVAIDDLRERNTVLEQRLVRARQSPTIASAQPVVTLPPHLSKVKIEADAPEDGKASEDVQQTGEQRLYSKVLELYRGHKEAELQQAVKILLKAFPDSIYADNALYLAGLLAFETNDMAHSNAYMERVLREYPNGNKSVSALFAKAMIAKRERKFQEAKVFLQNVRSRYPGSPEAMRAGTEEKLIELAANGGKGREG